MRKALKIYTILLTVQQVFPRRKPCSMKPRWNRYCDSSFNERVSGFDHQIIFSLLVHLKQPSNWIKICFQIIPLSASKEEGFVITSSPQYESSRRFHNKHGNLTSRRSVITQNVGQNFSKPREIIYLRTAIRVIRCGLVSPGRFFLNIRLTASTLKKKENLFTFWTGWDICTPGPIKT